MNLTVGTAARTWKPFGGHYLVAALGLAVAMAVVAGIGVWQATDSGGGTTATKPTFVPATTTRPAFYYIVRDEAQAAQIDAATDDAARIRAASGDFGPVEEVYTVVAADPDAVKVALKDAALMNGLRADTGLPEMKVVDLR